jgi:hypothetical protein
MTDDCPFDGVVPVGRPEPRIAAPAPKSESALDRIINTRYESLGFGDFAKLKSGRDSFSGVKLPQLKDSVSEMDRNSIAEAFAHDESSQASCFRWMLRGLDSKKAIRKVQTDLEISEKAISKRKR